MIKVNDTVVFEGCESKVLVVGKDHLHIDWNDEYIEVKKDEVKFGSPINKYPDGYLPKISFHLCEMHKTFTKFMEHKRFGSEKEGHYWREYLLRKRSYDYFVDKQIKSEG